MYEKLGRRSMDHHGRFHKKKQMRNTFVFDTETICSKKSRVKNKKTNLSNSRILAFWPKPGNRARICRKPDMMHAEEVGASPHGVLHTGRTGDIPVLRPSGDPRPL